jgi:hypothetical protein
MTKLSKKEMIWIAMLMAIGIVLFKAETAVIGWLVAGLAIGFIGGFTVSVMIAKKANTKEDGGEQPKP